MRWGLHIYHHADPELLGLLARMTSIMEKIMLDFSRLEAEISDMTSAVDGAIALLTQLAQELRDNAANQAKILEIANAMDAKSAALAEAVVVNTPSAPTP